VRTEFRTVKVSKYGFIGSYIHRKVMVRTLPLAPLLLMAANTGFLINKSGVAQLIRFYRSGPISR
jgi:hypothetical protein